MLMWTGIAERVTLVRRTRLAWVSKPDFQVGIRAATASTSGCSSECFSRFRDSGTPRYLEGNGVTTQGNTNCTACITSSEHRIGVATHLSMLVTKPDAPAKSCSICNRHCKSAGFGATRTTRSSA
jgi:hypothetical protein